MVIDTPRLMTVIQMPCLSSAIPLFALSILSRTEPSANPALNLAPSSRWTLRDKAAQRRLALLQGLPQIRKCA
jgi:hypothetical protein